MDFLVWIFLLLRDDVVLVVKFLEEKFKNKLLFVLYGIFFLVKDNIYVVGVKIINVCEGYIIVLVEYVVVVQYVFDVGGIYIGKINFD